MSDTDNAVPQPDNDAAIAFLNAFEPEGPWVLTAIPPHRKGIQTRTFGPDCMDQLKQWLVTRNGNANLYFHVNRPLRNLDKKAEREDIKEVRWLHVDVDPRVNEPVEDEQRRILSLMTDRLPAGIPKPTVILFSGGGYQAFWRLEGPIVLDGKLELAETAALYNVAMEHIFQGDNCHNIDRIMRLPGTVNIPDERKRLKGRRPALARVVTFDTSRVYPLSAFTPAAPTRSDQSAALGRPGQSNNSVKIGGNVRRIIESSELDEWGVPDRVKIIIGQGKHPDEPKSDDNSRSAWLFDAVCNLVRQRVPDEVIFSLLTDPHWAISESVLEKGNAAEKYAIRQIERAKEEVISPELRLLNEKHFVIENDAGKCRVAEWIPSEGDGRDQLSTQSFEDFRNRYMHMRVLVGKDAKNNPQFKPLGRFWLEHEKRRQFRGLVFRPGNHQVINGFLNLWRGFGVEPRPGRWSRMQAHIAAVLADGDESSAEYILNWAAWAVQNPDQPAEVALVFKGGQGTGKSTFGRAMRSLFGQHGLQVVTPSQFAGRFNAHMRDVCLLFADEAVRPDDRSARGILKALLTERNLPMEGKGRDIVQMTNYAKVIMASNEEWVVTAELDDRRFAVFRVSEGRKGDKPYFKALNEELEAGGLEAMLYDLLERPLGEWHPRVNIPQTAEKDFQKTASLTGLEKWLLDLLHQGVAPVQRWVTEKEPFVATSTLTEVARQQLRKEDISWNAVNYLLTRLQFKKIDNSRPRGFVFPELRLARATWNRVFTRVEWDDTGEWAPLDPSKTPFEPPF
ncbi:hypothetical protein ACVIWV_007679 [Bradyrhizobium diazoefficiens]